MGSARSLYWTTVVHVSKVAARLPWTSSWALWTATNSQECFARMRGLKISAKTGSWGRQQSTCLTSERPSSSKIRPLSRRCSIVLGVRESPQPQGVKNATTQWLQSDAHLSTERLTGFSKKSCGRGTAYAGAGGTPPKTPAFDCLILAIFNLPLRTTNESIVCAAVLGCRKSYGCISHLREGKGPGCGVLPSGCGWKR